MNDQRDANPYNEGKRKLGCPEFKFPASGDFFARNLCPISLLHSSCCENLYIWMWEIYKLSPVDMWQMYLYKYPKKCSSHLNKVVGQGPWQPLLLTLEDDVVGQLLLEAVLALQGLTLESSANYLLLDSCSRSGSCTDSLCWVWAKKSVRMPPTKDAS